MEITIIILAGGISRRLGRDKAAEPFGDETLLRRVVRRASESVGSNDVVIVVANTGQSERAPADIPHRLVLDALPGSGTLGGTYTGLEAARSEWALVVACDLPFLSAPLLHYMTGLRDGVDAVVPVIDGRPEPTHALYSRRCIPSISQRLQAGQLKAAGFLDLVRVRYVDEGEARRFRPGVAELLQRQPPRGSGAGA